MQDIAMIGYGAIGRRAARLITTDRIATVLVRPGSASAEAVEADGLRAVETLPALLALRPGLVVECAGHEALAGFGPAVLEAGVTLVIASAGALADRACRGRLEAAARGSGAALWLVSGAIGGLDALVAMRLVGLEQVRYIARKPPAAWAGTAAEATLDLAALIAPAIVFEGDARAAALAYPKNANVAATLALAGLGFARTHVTLIADPGVVHNVHEIRAEGVTGALEMRLEGLPDPENPRTSALTAASVAAVALGRIGALRLA